MLRRLAVFWCMGQGKLRPYVGWCRYFSMNPPWCSRGRKAAHARDRAKGCRSRPL